MCMLSYTAIRVRTGLAAFRVDYLPSSPLLVATRATILAFAIDQRRARRVEDMPGVLVLDEFCVTSCRSQTLGKGAARSDLHQIVGDTVEQPDWLAGRYRIVKIFRVAWCVEANVSGE